MTLSDPLTVIGMVNGMIGGFILILPVNGLHAGLIFTLLVIIIIGAFSYYSCYLCVVHLGDQKDLDHSMFNHFNKSYVIKIIYDLTVFSNLLFLGFLYFDLICIQW
jgi:amino acid permease